MRIDSHQHFWKYDAERDRWITPDMQVLQQDFLPAHLEGLLKANDFDGCITVQADQSEAENAFLLAAASENNFIKGVVGWLDFQSEELADKLRYYRQFPLLKGFRHGLQAEPQRDMMLRPDFMRGIGQLRDHGFVYEVLVLADQLQFIAAFVGAFPDQKFVIDHMAKPDIKNGGLERWKTDIAAVAEHENVWCKVSGLVTEASWHTWKNEDFEPYLDVVVSHFGTGRIMYGSDWPVCLLAASSYEAQLQVSTDYFGKFSKSEQAAFYGLNAKEFYTLKDL